MGTIRLSDSTQTSLIVGLVVGLFTLSGGFFGALLLRWLDNQRADRLRQRQLQAAITTVFAELTADKIIVRQAAEKTWSWTDLPVRLRAYEETELLLAELLPPSALVELTAAYHTLRVGVLLGPPAAWEPVLKQIELATDALEAFRNRGKRPSRIAQLKSLLSGALPRSR